MPQSDPIEFWFSIGSLYTFLTVMRMDRVEDTTDVRFVWRPFRIRTIMEEELERAFQGQQTAQQALATATTRGNVVLRNFERANRG